MRERMRNTSMMERDIAIIHFISQRSAQQTSSTVSASYSTKQGGGFLKATIYRTNDDRETSEAWRQVVMPRSDTSNNMYG
jgi:hypothetical protein